MLIEATLADVERYGEWVYSMALNPQTSGYPTYADGIKTKADFFEDARRGVTRDDSSLLLFEYAGAVEGWMQYFTIEQERYLQLCACNIRTGTRQALTELLAHLSERFHGYTLYFGFPGENTEAIGFLQENGFACVESLWNHSFFLADYEPHAPDARTQRIGRENYGDFRAVYHPDADTYWNAERIWASLDAWILWVYYRSGAPVGTMLVQSDPDCCEIFGMEWIEGGQAEGAESVLLRAALNACKQAGARYVTWLCEESQRRLLAEASFRCVGQYLCYVKKI